MLIKKYIFELNVMKIKILIRILFKKISVLITIENKFSQKAFCKKKNKLPDNKL